MSNKANRTIKPNEPSIALGSFDFYDVTDVALFALNIPLMGISCSHRGNKTFPGWEYSESWGSFLLLTTMLISLCDVIHHPPEALLLTRRETPVSTRGSDVALLGGSDFIVCGPHRCWRTGVVVVSPAYKSRNF